MKKKCQEMIKSFGNAVAGLRVSYRERNMKVHLLIMLLVIEIAAWSGLNMVEWGLILISIGVVLGAEIFNTSIEEMADVVKKKCKCDYEETRRVRDLAAGAVLVAAVMAALVGILVLGPKVWELVL